MNISLELSACIIKKKDQKLSIKKNCSDCLIHFDDIQEGAAHPWIINYCDSNISGNVKSSVIADRVERVNDKLGRWPQNKRTTRDNWLG